MKRGAYLVNTARGKICDRDAVVRALETGQLAGYAGDVWFPQPAPQRPSVALDASSRHDAAHLRHQPLGSGPLRGRNAARSSSASSTGRPIRDEYLIVDAGSLAGSGAHSYSAGDATGGSEEAARCRRPAGWSRRRAARLVVQRRAGGHMTVIGEEQDRELARDETPAERVDRNFNELLGELRIALPGVQVLFAFLLTVPFAQRFPQLTGFQRGLYFAVLLLTALACALLIAPTAYHRLQFRRGRKTRSSLRQPPAVRGLGALALAMSGAILLITDLLFGAASAIPVGAAAVLCSPASGTWCPCAAAAGPRWTGAASSGRPGATAFTGTAGDLPATRASSLARRGGRAVRSAGWPGRSLFRAPAVAGMRPRPS